MHKLAHRVTLNYWQNVAKSSYYVDADDVDDEMIKNEKISFPFVCRSSHHADDVERQAASESFLSSHIHIYYV